MNRIIARLNKKATRMTKTALKRGNFSEDLTPENWERINNDSLLANACEKVLDGPFPKLTNQMVEGLIYAIDNGINGKKFDYLVAYLTERKTSDDAMYDTIVQYVDVYGPTEYTKLDLASFINFTVQGGNAATKGALNKIGVQWDTTTLEEVFAIIDVYFNGQVTDYNRFTIADVAYVYFLGADDEHCEFMKNWKKAKGLPDDVKHEIRDLIALNADIEKLKFITEYAEYLQAGDASAIIYDYDGDIETLINALQKNNFDEILYPGLTAMRIRRMQKNAMIKTRRMLKY